MTETSRALRLSNLVATAIGPLLFAFFFARLNPGANAFWLGLAIASGIAVAARLIAILAAPLFRRIGRSELATQGMVGLVLAIMLAWLAFGPA